jgi:RNA polymerase sigma-70 factor (sigma-E family)
MVRPGVRAPTDLERSVPVAAPADPRAGFDEFVTARSSGLLRTAYLLTRDRGLAEDLLQTALSKAWFAWSRIDADPEPYVRRILVNTYATWWRRRWNGERPTHIDDGSPDALPPAAGHDEASAARHDLWVAMGRLPRRQRAVIVLRFFEDLTEAQTAAALDCSVGTVKSQTAKALARLRVDPALGPELGSDAGPRGTPRPSSSTIDEGRVR